MANQSNAFTVHYDDLVAQHPPPVLVIKKQPRSAGPEGAGKNTRFWKYPLAVLSIAEVPKRRLLNKVSFARLLNVLYLI